jgi:hypothetical protein
MPLDLLDEPGLLLVAVVTAFAIGSGVGILVGELWSMSRAHGEAPDASGRRPWHPDAADEAPINRPPSEDLASARNSSI